MKRKFILIAVRCIAAVRAARTAYRLIDLGIINILVNIATLSVNPILLANCAKQAIATKRYRGKCLNAKSKCRLGYGIRVKTLQSLVISSTSNTKHPFSLLPSSTTQFLEARLRPSHLLLYHKLRAFVLVNTGHFYQ